jgi:hypothetical protein
MSTFSLKWQQHKPELPKWHLELARLIPQVHYFMSQNISLSQKISFTHLLHFKSVIFFFQFLNSQLLIAMIIKADNLKW